MKERVSTSAMMAKDSVRPVTVVSICDGMGGSALALKSVNATVDRYIAYELDTDKSIIADNANPESHVFPGIYHTVGNDVRTITEQDVMNWGTVDLLCLQPPCYDHSPLRLM